MKKIDLIVASLYFFFSVLFTEEILVTTVGISLSIFMFLSFVKKLGTEYPIKEFIILLMCLQWIVGAKFSYEFGANHHKYYMYVEEAEYMHYVVLGVVFFAIALYLVPVSLSVPKLKEEVSNNKEYYLPLAKKLVVIGFLGKMFLLVVSSGGAAFILYLVGMLFFVGVGLLFFVIPQYKWPIFFTATLLVFLQSLRIGMFHDFILTTVFLLFIIIPRDMRFVTKIVLLVLGSILLNIIQLVKGDFRTALAESRGGNSVEIFLNLAFNQIQRDSSPDAVFLVNKRESAEEKEISDANNRLNQGWIISKVLSNVPKNRPFLNGATIVESIEAALLPRFLAPNKAGASEALDNFRDISGLELSKTTSMGLSVIAEFYANYGIEGGWIAMFIYGLFLSLMIKYIVVVLGDRSYLILLWFFIFFFQVVKAETDFIKVLNHLVKSVLIFIAIKQVFKFLNLPLFKR